MLKIVAVAAAAFVIAAPALAQTSPPPQPSSLSKVKDPNRIICERQEELGTRLGAKKVCKTAAEWDEERHANRESSEEMQRMNTSVGKPAG